MKSIVIGVVLSLVCLAPAAEMKLAAELHPESGEPVLTWDAAAAGADAASFEVVRSGKPLIAGLGREETRWFDMRTFAGDDYEYEIVARDAAGVEVARSNAVSVTSQRKAFTIEGRMPVVLGWAQVNPDAAFDLHANLLLRGPATRAVRDGQRLYRMTFVSQLDEEGVGRTRAERFRNVVLDPWHVGWDIYDESDSVAQEQPKVIEIRKHDAFTPIVGNVMPQHARTPLAGLTEIFSVEHYSDHANWPSVTLPAARAAMDTHAGEFSRLPVPQELWMCFDLYSVRTARSPSAFTRHSVFSALAYGAKGLYFFNDPGPDGFIDGPGIRLMRKQREMVGILGAEMRAWGRHLLYSEFAGEAIVRPTQRISQPLSDNSWWKTIVHPAYPEFVGKKVPSVQAAVQRHPRGLFVFVLPNMEIDYHAKDIVVAASVDTPAGAKAYRLTPGMPEVKIESAARRFALHAGTVYAAEAFLVTADEALARQIGDELESFAREIHQRATSMAAWDIEDAATFLGLCADSAEKTELAARLENARAISDPLVAQAEAERLFRAIIGSDLRSKAPYAPSAAQLRHASAVTPDSTPTAGDNLALAGNASATMTHWVFPMLANQNNSPHLAIDGLLEAPAKVPWGGVNTAWVFSHSPVEPYPVLTIELASTFNIGEIRVKQLVSEDAPPSITRLAIEFVDDGSVEFFDLRDATPIAKLTFPARTSRTLRLIPIAYRPDTQSHGIVEVQVYAAPADGATPNYRERTPIGRTHHNVDLTTFGW